jgi:pimeloyl-ACP methyl ester carboxylesterase
LSRVRLEEYSWRDQEAKLNASVPQFRTGMLLPGTESAVRVHFIHAPSPHSNAVPLLLIPPFPFTNLSLSHLIPIFTDPDDAGANQPFHLVIPSLPGLGFSDALPHNAPVVASTAELLDTLMKRLDYPHYIISNSGSSSSSLSEVDLLIVEYLARSYPESCLGAHLISPPLSAPAIGEASYEWAKWTAVKLLRRPAWGYTQEDLSATFKKTTTEAPASEQPAPGRFGLDKGFFQEPNTLSYALCDSPTGLLVFFMMILRQLGSQKNRPPEELITLTELTWLPGPEAMLRLWAQCVYSRPSDAKPGRSKPTVSLTVFLGDEDSTANAPQGAFGVLPRPTARPYACPSWGRTRYNVVSAQRVHGSPGIPAWDSPDVIVGGVRALSKAILAVDKQMQKAELPGAVLLEQVTIGRDTEAPAGTSGTTVQVPSGSLSSVLKKPVSPALDSPHLQVPGQEARLKRPSLSRSLPSPSGTANSGLRSHSSLGQSLGSTVSPASPSSPPVSVGA